MGLLYIDDHISESILLENGWENGLRLIGIVGKDSLEVNTYADITTYIHSCLK